MESLFGSFYSAIGFQFTGILKEESIFICFSERACDLISTCEFYTFHTWERSKVFHAHRVYEKI